MPSIAIVGLSCCFPDAGSPGELWETVLSQRRAFRRIPEERLQPADYWDQDPSSPDRTYLKYAAVLKNYAFDRVKFRVSGSTYRSADLAHWLALDVAARALEDAGFAEGVGLPLERTGVVVGNSLTGEFSRANLMRLRWPYVRRVLDAALKRDAWPRDRRRDFLADVERDYKRPFPEVGTETLAGGLANTIAGRICNHFDLKGGGFTVDGACASSLLAVINACTALESGDADVAVAGGVDLSLDPFELVGFAKVGALASDAMRVYDERSHGFWPGEGCGMVVLMRQADAVARKIPVRAVIRGWGISSDGSGGITRPEVEGQILAVRRAYARAAFGIETVALFEGHGTGTAVGDATELRVLTTARMEADPAGQAAAIGSIKANIGHTKAAAGLAGLIKAVLALEHQTLPPTTGCETPHRILAEAPHVLRPLSRPEPWPEQLPLRAGVSAMGFGGINTHVVVEGFSEQSPPRTAFPLGRVHTQDAEVFFFSGRHRADVLDRVNRLLALAPRLSFAELGDVAAHLAHHLDGRRVRAAVVAASADELAQRLQVLHDLLASGESEHFQDGLYLGETHRRIGFLLPGQGAPVRRNGGAMARRFPFVRRHVEATHLPDERPDAATELAQPAITACSAAALGVLARLGIRADSAVGHSLGELTAMHWAGAFNRAALRRVAKARGEAMASLGDPTGTMAAVSAGAEDVAHLLSGTDAVVAGYNGARQTTVSGSRDDVATIVERARTAGFPSVFLRVSHAFHSPLVAAAAPVLRDVLSRESFRPLRRTVFSTVAGRALTLDDDLRELLCAQITSPVRFTDAFAAATENADLWIEVGPGRVLEGLARELSDVPVVATDAGAASLTGLLNAVAAAFAAGAPVRSRVLFADRFTRPIDLNAPFRFLSNPCEEAPKADPDSKEAPVTDPHAQAAAETDPDAQEVARSPDGAPADFRVENHTGDPTAEPVMSASSLEVVRRLVAERTELPLESVSGEDRLLSDLHLNSITVSELVVAAAREIGRHAPVSPTLYADASVSEIAESLDGSPIAGTADGAVERQPPGASSWVRAFEIVMAPRPRVPAIDTEHAGTWRIVAPAGHPLTPPLESALGGRGPERGVVALLPPNSEREHVDLLLDAVQVLRETDGGRFVLIQHGAGAASFARSIHMELPHVATCVVDVPFDAPNLVEQVIEETRAVRHFAEAHIDESGIRSEPRLRLLPLRPESPTSPLLGPEDVLLVTGGGKGIASECALDLARRYGSRLVLMGRSRPDDDPTLQANLDRFTAAGITFRYHSADVADAAAVGHVIDRSARDLGRITAVLHGAGRNVPKPLFALDADDVRRTLAPKVDGLRNILDAVDHESLRLLVTFGSIIARIGMPGEADYALANERQTRLTERWQRHHPHCRCLAVEWSVWEDLGMGARLGTIEALMRRGVTPIPVDEGVRMLSELLEAPIQATAVVVSGRFGEPPTLRLEERPLPLLRFLERPRVHYPGIELVTEATLSVDTDPYLADHVLQGEHLFPAVMGLEAMAEAAAALLGEERPPLFEEVSFRRPIVVPPGDPLTIRIAAAVETDGRISTVLRSEQTNFQTDHFRAMCRFDVDRPAELGSPVHLNGSDNLPIDPLKDLYGGLLFHGGRFQRLRAYRSLKATSCVAEVATETLKPWFGGYLAQDLMLGDPAVRDAAIHAVQACIPHAVLVPTAVDRLVPAEPYSGPACFVHAQERSRTGDTFVYDVTVTDPDGTVLERWAGLHLRRIAAYPNDAAVWPLPLLAPYLERRIQELAPGSDVSVSLVRTGLEERSRRTLIAVGEAIGEPVPVTHRPNGRPEVPGSRGISVSHADSLTFAVAGSGALGCDVESVRHRPPAVWRDLLGPESFALARFVSSETGEDFDTAATRVWAAAECFKKSGVPPDVPVTLDDVPAPGWVVVRGGGFVALSYIATIQSMSIPSAVSVLLRRPADLPP